MFEVISRTGALEREKPSRTLTGVIGRNKLSKQAKQLGVHLALLDPEVIESLCGLVLV